jgi:hypothetical protein
MRKVVKLDDLKTAAEQLEKSPPANPKGPAPGFAH